MKVYGKYLVMAYHEGFKERRIASTFMTKREAIEALNRCFGKTGKRINDNLWEDSLGQRFYVEKNTKEYK